VNKSNDAIRNWTGFFLTLRRNDILKVLIPMLTCAYNTLNLLFTCPLMFDLWIKTLRFAKVPWSLLFPNIRNLLHNFCKSIKVNIFIKLTDNMYKAGNDETFQKFSQNILRKYKTLYYIFHFWQILTFLWIKNGQSNEDCFLIYLSLHVQMSNTEMWINVHEATIHKDTGNTKYHIEIT
jgi:hypothetical protein